MQTHIFSSTMRPASLWPLALEKQWSSLSCGPALLERDHNFNVIELELNYACAPAPYIHLRVREPHFPVRTSARGADAEWNQDCKSRTRERTRPIWQVIGAPVSVAAVVAEGAGAPASRVRHNKRETI